MALTESERTRAKYLVAALGAGTVLYLLTRFSVGRRPLRTDAPGWQRSQGVIAKLHPSIQPMAQQTISEAWNQGIPLVVASGLRTYAEQQALFDQGRTKPGAIVTNSRPGDSWHNHGLAFDVAVLDASNKPTWPNDLSLWSKIGAIGKAQGLSWGGDWKGFVDRPHFEFHPGMTLADAKAGKRPAIA
jgi:peptidoglycan L-alanyl-D-glutamate endopeptidase CwlK